MKPEPFLEARPAPSRGRPCLIALQDQAETLLKRERTLLSKVTYLNPESILAARGHVLCRRSHRHHSRRPGTDGHRTKSGSC